MLTDFNFKFDCLAPPREFLHRNRVVLTLHLFVYIVCNAHELEDYQRNNAGDQIAELKRCALIY